MERLQIYLPTDMRQWLRHKAYTGNVSQAAVIRGVIARAQEDDLQQVYIEENEGRQRS